MIGNIRRPNPLKPFDPSEYFDPTTNTCTEANFIKILEHGYYDSSLIGKFVTLSNTVDYDGGKQVIADVNHDSENTGQNNCYDLISADCFHQMAFSSYYNIWYSSNIISWLNNSFYDGFSSAFKARMINPKHYSKDSWLESWKIIIPSYNEVSNSSRSDVYTEGITYPIFTDNNSRIKKYYNSVQSWWTRTAYKYDSSVLMSVYTSGSTTTSSCNAGLYLAPLMRIQ